MFFFSRTSRQPTPEDPHSEANNHNNNTNSDSAGNSESPVDQGGDSYERPWSYSPAQMSKDSEGYPSWLPKRPPPPAPASTFQSSVGIPEPITPGPSDSPMSPMMGGRKPTPG
ncbi:hypothetical protein MPER_12678, partial [Moniliophthora perniciosa FA553]